MFQLANDQFQIINLGAGYDTLYWKLRDEGLFATRYVEVDFTTTTSSKCQIIRTVPTLYKSIETGKDRKVLNIKGLSNAFH